MTKTRAWLLSALPLVSLIALAVTTIVPDWIERVFGAEPDGGDGMAEALITWALVIVTVAGGLGAIRSWWKLARNRREKPAGITGESS